MEPTQPPGDKPFRRNPTSEERRRTRRSLCSELATIRFLDQTGKRVELTGLIEDISPEGVCLSLSAPLAPGRLVELLGEGIESQAEVRYCEMGDYSYLAGLRFSGELRWSREEWRPQHLYTPFD